jgi:hypothetical protein
MATYALGSVGGGFLFSAVDYTFLTPEPMKLLQSDPPSGGLWQKLSDGDTSSFSLLASLP